MYPNSILDEIRERIGKYLEEDGDKIKDIGRQANYITWEALKVVEYELNMEIVSAKYDVEGNYEMYFARFGVDKNELSIFGNVFSSSIELVWDVFSLTGYIRKKFYTPHRNKTYFVTLEDMIGQLKRYLRYFIGEEVFLQSPTNNDNVVTLYTKTYTISFSYGLDNVKDSLLLMFAMNGFNISIRNSIYAIR